MLRPLVSSWVMVIFCVPWIVPVGVFCSLLPVFGGSCCPPNYWGYGICFLVLWLLFSYFFWQIHFVLSRLWEWPSFVFFQCSFELDLRGYVGVLATRPPRVVLRQPLIPPPQPPAVSNFHARSVACTRRGCGLRVRTTRHFSGRQGGVFGNECWLVAAGEARVQRMWRPTSSGNEDVLICINASFMTTRFKAVMVMNLLELRS